MEWNYLLFSLCIVVCFALQQWWMNKRMKQHQMELAKSEKMFRTVVTNLKEVVFQTDIRGSFIFLNPAWQEVTGYEVEESMGHGFEEYVHPDDQQLIITGFISLQQRMGISCRHNVRLVTKDGGVRWMEAYARLRVDEGNQILGTDGTLNDLTERMADLEELQHAKEAAEAANRAKGDFLANMSHELRTPMNAILGMTAVLLETSLNQEQQDLAATVHESAEALLMIINDTLDYSKIEAGKMTLEDIPFCVRNIVEGVADLTACTARNKGLPVMAYVDPEIPRTLRGDPGRLRQILFNLVGNAVKFTQTGEVIVRAVLQERTDDAVTVRFMVMDTGIGIKEETKNNLFKPFTQADSSMARKFGGTGLGLSIAKRLVELIKGEIGVESIWGSGSTFWFTAQFTFDAAADASGSPLSLPIAGLDRYQAVIVSDSMMTTDIVARYLQTMGVGGTESCSSNDWQKGPGQNVLREQELLILDTDYVKTAAPVGALPVLTLGACEKMRGEAGQSGIHLTKPVKFDLLAGSLRALLSDDQAALILPSSTCAAADLKPVNGQNRDAISDTVPACEANGILVVEDNRANQKLALLLLKKLGYKAEAVNDGREAVNTVLNGNYAAILMDCQMPEMDGFEATRQIRDALMNKADRIPIIAMTANAMEGDREKCIASGMDDYLSKPIKPEALRTMLEHWLANNEGRGVSV